MNLLEAIKSGYEFRREREALEQRHEAFRANGREPENSLGIGMHVCLSLRALVVSPLWKETIGRSSPSPTARRSPKRAPKFSRARTEGCFSRSDRMDCVLGIDIGTNGTKCALYSAHGERVDFASREYGLLYPREGWVEQRAGDWWDALVAGVAEIAGRNRRGNRIAAMALSAQGGALVLLANPLARYFVH